MLKDEIAYKRFVWEFSNIIKNCPNNKKIIFVCIGTKNVVGDSIGPLVGSSLKQLFINNKKIKVVGDINNNMCYSNIDYQLRNIEKSTLVIVIDSALSKGEDIGKVFVSNRGLKYGEALRKKSRVIGDISIKAVVGKDLKSRLANFNELKNVSEGKIKYLTNIISTGISDVIHSCEYNV